MTRRTKTGARVRAPLTELESEVMRAVWSSGRCSVKAVHRIVARKRDLKETTVRTLKDSDFHCTMGPGTTVGGHGVASG